METALQHSKNKAGEHVCWGRTDNLCTQVPSFMTRQLDRRRYLLIVGSRRQTFGSSSGEHSTQKLVTFCEHCSTTKNISVLWRR